MKCDISEVWKLALSHKKWKDEQALQKKIVDEAELLHVTKKELLTKEGWEFSVGSFAHPHNNSEWLETTFKSPRMLYHRTYFGTDFDFRKEEAKSLANSYTPQYEPLVRLLINSTLEDYFYENRAAWVKPTLKIKITDEEDNQISCVIG